MLKIRSFSALRTALHHSEVARHVTVLSMGSVLSQLIPIVMSVVLSRLYSTENYGDFSVFISVATILSVVVSARYDYAIVRSKNQEEAFSLVLLSGTIAVGVALVTAFVVGLCYGLRLKGLPVGLGWLPVYTLAIAIFQIAWNYCNYLESYKRITAALVSRSLAQALSRTLFGVIKYEVGLIVGCVLGVVCGCGVFLSRWKRTQLPSMSNVHVSLKQVGKTYINFPKYFLFSGLLNTFSTNLPILLFSFFYSKDYIGLFSMSISILYLPITMIGNAIGQVFYKKAAVWELDKSRQLAKHFLRFCALLGLVIFVVLWVGKDGLFALVLGEPWRTCGSYSLILSPWLLSVLCISPLSWIFDVLDKQKTEMYLNIAMFLSRAVVILGSGFFDFAFETSLFFYSIVGLLLWMIEGKVIFGLLDMRLSLRQQLALGLCVVVVIVGVVCRLW